MRKLFVLILVLFVLNLLLASKVLAQSNAFRLQTGDLLFQDLSCGPLCTAITEATQGYHHDAISHVAIVLDTDASEPTVLEAYQSGVAVLPLSDFLARSTDANGQPKVLVGRLKPAYQHLITPALIVGKAQLGQPYNNHFLLTSPGFYCSQLIAYMFKQANHQQAVFPQQAMNFRNLNTGHYAAAWRDYFAELHQAIPQGRLGTNPAALSTDPHLTIVYQYGQLTPVSYN